MYNLGVAFENGLEGVGRDFIQAVAWYHKAALRGHPIAQFNLGCMHTSGHGVRRPDPVEAVRWYRKAAEQGHTTGRSALFEPLE